MLYKLFAGVVCCSYALVVRSFVQTIGAFILMRKHNIDHLSYCDLVDGMLYNAHRAQFCDEVVRRAAEAGETAVDHLTKMLNAESPACAVPMPSQTSVPSQMQRRQAAASKIRKVRTAVDVSECVSAVLNSGWDFVDPAGLMNKTPAQVVDFLNSLTVDFPSSWSELGQTPTRQNLLRMIIESWYRWSGVSEEVV